MIVDRLKVWFEQLPAIPERIWVAYSGGRDSHVLLHALRSALERCDAPFPGSALIACHVNHRLSEYSDDWAAHCQQVADSLELSILTKTLTTHPKKGDSIEAWARQARYEWFQSLLEPGDLLCTAHTQNDQAETVLINLIRGSGLQGLSSIAPIKVLGSGMLARPLLNIDRNGIDAYVSEFNLNYIDDDSNTNLKFKRNYIRHELIPNMIKRYPSVVSTLARTAKHAREANLLLDEVAALDLERLLLPNGRILASKLAQLSYPRQKNVFRYWLRLNAFPLPSEVKLDDILRQLIEAGIDRHPKIQWGEVEVRRVKGEVILLRTENMASI
ncbi:MAG: tRNA lysidine(34) synthetase TilS [Gammaproteobacteria bacterium]